MKINMVFRDAFNCFDNVIVSLLEAYNCSYELLYANSWYFSYKPLEDEDTIGQNLYFDTIYAWHNLEKYHGAKTMFFEDKNKENIINNIKNFLSDDIPVVIHTDTFWCPWYKIDYKKYHSDHFCLIIAYDGENNFTVQDAQLAKEGQILPLNDLLNGIIGYGVVKLTDKKEKINCRSILKQSLQYVSKSDGKINFFNKIEFLAEDIKLKLNFNKEIAGYEDTPYESNLFQQVLNVGRSRKQYAIFLEFLFKVNKDIRLCEVSKRMKKVGDKWTSVFGLLCKAHCMGSERNAEVINRVVEKIKNLSMEEREILDSIMEFVNSTEIKEYFGESKEKISDRQLSEYHFVDLEGYYNCKSVSTKLTNNTRAEITSERRYILGDDLMKQREWKIGDARYMFPRVYDENLNDNISCEGQRIKVNSVKGSQIMFLGCAELGNHIENIEIEYDSGEKEAVELEFTSWLSSPVFGESIAWEGKGVERIGEEVSVYPFSVYLFSVAIAFDKTGNIIGINLPQCPNIHIFAITLAN